MASAPPPHEAHRGRGSDFRCRLPLPRGTSEACAHPPQPSSGLKLLKMNSGGTSQGDLALGPLAHQRVSSLPRTGSQPWAVFTEEDV